MNEAKLVEIAQKVLDKMAAMSDEELWALADEYADAPIGRAIMGLPSCDLPSCDVCVTISHFHMVQPHTFLAYDTTRSRTISFSAVSPAANDGWYQLAA